MNVVRPLWMLHHIAPPHRQSPAVIMEEKRSSVAEWRAPEAASDLYFTCWWSKSVRGEKNNQMVYDALTDFTSSAAFRAPSAGLRRVLMLITPVTIDSWITGWFSFSLRFFMFDFLTIPRCIDRFCFRFVRVSRLPCDQSEGCVEPQPRGAPLRQHRGQLPEQPGPRRAAYSGPRARSDTPLLCSVPGHPSWFRTGDTESRNRARWSIFSGKETPFWRVMWMWGGY